MLDCEGDENHKNSNCKHCQASGESEPEQQQQQRYWDIPLDQDLLETIVSIYPEWFKDCNMSAATSTTDHSTSDNTSICTRLSSAPSPKVKQEDGEPKTIDENKESLKVKLMLRRPLNQLVDQRVLPSLKSPPAFHEQRHKFEKAKMGDILKHKLQKRPDRQETVQKNILEEPVVDPSLDDKQKQLKKVRLADTLNKLVALKPMPTDLQQKRNVFQADEILAQAVRDSALPFYDVPSPKVKTILDEDSESEVAFPPSPLYDFSEHSQSSLPSVDASEPSPNPLHAGSPCSGRTSFSMSPPSSVSSPVSAAVFHSIVSPAQDQIAEYLAQHMQHHHQQHHQQQQNHCDGTRESTASKNRKKTKPKTQPKARTIKFHEYRGPPNAPKNATTTTLSVPLTESHSDLWLQQQQLFLRLQQECLQNHTQGQNGQVITSQVPNGEQIGQTVQKLTPEKKPQQVVESPGSPQKLLSNFEDLKVTDLRAELKKKGLPVSGSKPTLIKRLRSHVPSVTTTQSSNTSQAPSPPPTIATNLTPSHTTTTISVDNLLEGLHPTISIPTSDSTLDVTPETLKGILSSLADGDSLPASLIPMDTEALEIQEISDSSSTSLSNEDIVQLQQIWIEKLQKDLERSRKQLQQCQLPVDTSPVINAKPIQNQTLKTPAPPMSIDFPKTEAPSPMNTKVAQRQIIHQFLQQKIQQQELQKAQRQQVSISSPQSTTTSTVGNSTLTALLKSSPLNATALDIDLSSVDLQLDSVAKPVASFPGSIMSTQVQDSKRGVQAVKNDFPTITVQVDNTAMEITANEEDGFPGVMPIFVCHTSTEDTLPVVSATPALSNRSSSLPSFSALLAKAPPTRSNTDPQFQLTRPPPNYNEATRQLKVKQLHHLTPDRNDGNPQQTKKHKTSVKCQAVDDVLEILINNGELSPSAAQDPITPVSGTEQASLNLFRQSHEPFFAKTPLLSSSSAKDVANSASDLHLAQSLMDLTPPSSTGFADTGCPPSLDFDFPLDMTDIDAMDLDGMDNGHGHPDPTLSMSMAQDVKTPSLDYAMNKSAELANHLMKLSEATDAQDRGSNRGIDNDIIELLGDFEDPNSTSNNFRYSSTFGMTHDSDPLFSNGYDALDFFSTDDMDFKPQHELNFLPWGENAT